MYVCYILQSEKSGRFYIGHTEDIHARLLEHNSGRVVSTRGKGPWHVVHSENFASRSDASARERKIKSWKSPVLIHQLIDEQA